MRFPSSHFFSARVFGASGVLLVPAPSPGAVFRVVERDANAARSAFSRPVGEAASSETFVLQLSSPPVVSGLHLWRVFGFEPNREPASAAILYLTRIGPELSRALNHSVHLLTVRPGGTWEFVTWEAGVQTHNGRSETLNPSPTLWSRVRTALGLDAPFSALRTWERERGLPMKQILAITSHKPRRTIDYDTVAGLERKGLLVENEPVWYRYEIGPLRSPPAPLIGGRGAKSGIIKP